MDYLLNEDINQWELLRTDGRHCFFSLLHPLPSCVHLRLCVCVCVGVLLWSVALSLSLREGRCLPFLFSRLHFRDFYSCVPRSSRNFPKRIFLSVLERKTLSCCAGFGDLEDRVASQEAKGSR